MEHKIELKGKNYGSFYFSFSFCLEDNRENY